MSKHKLSAAELQELADAEGWEVCRLCGGVTARDEPHRCGPAAALGRAAEVIRAVVEGTNPLDHQDPDRGP